MMLKTLKTLIVLLALFQAWFCQAWFYPVAFADRRALAAAEKYVAARGGETGNIELTREVSQVKAPGLLVLAEIYGGSMRRGKTWNYIFQTGETWAIVYITPSGKIYVGDQELLVVPSTSFDVVRFEDGQ